MLARFLNPADLDMVICTRNVITNSVMAEIAQEFPDGRNEFKNAIHYHIVSFSQRINVCLLVLDKLIEIFNSSHMVS